MLAVISHAVGLIMKIYKRKDNHLYCGHWNGAPLEVGMTEKLMDIPKGEVNHSHEFHEFYLILAGRGRMEVRGEVVPIEKGSLLMIEPGEIHRIAAIDQDVGLQWVIIKEKSISNGKHVAGIQHAE
jgi:mannose-6-phosphate isomerase-like protein (cupin superfamily)